MQLPLLKAIDSHDSVEVIFIMCKDDNHYSTVRSILVNKEGKIKVLHDYTE